MGKPCANVGETGGSKNPAELMEPPTGTAGLAKSSAAPGCLSEVSRLQGESKDKSGVIIAAKFSRSVKAAVMQNQIDAGIFSFSPG
jgi:hypothetical protein